jgi:hypothetical protein
MGLRLFRTNGRDEKCYKFLAGNPKRKSYLGELDVDGRKVL